MRVKQVCSVLLLSMLALLFLPDIANAQCNRHFLVTPDGRVSDPVTVPFGTSIDVDFSFIGHQGRSYSVEIVNLDFFSGGSLRAVNGNLSNVSFCPTVNMTGVRDTDSIEPQTAGSGPGFSFSAGGVLRFSFTAPATDVYDLRVGANSVSVQVTVSVSDTTLFNSAWSTFGTFETFYSIVNTTRATLNATLKLFDTTGTEVASFDFTNIPAGGTVSTNTSALAVANDLNGSATLTHNAPPGAVIAEAAIANFAVTPNIIQPVRFGPVRQGRD